MLIHKCSDLIHLKWIQILCNQFIVDINCIISIININTTDQQNTIQISTSLVQIIPWLKSHWKLERYSIQCPFGNTCTDIKFYFEKCFHYSIYTQNCHWLFSVLALSQILSIKENIQHQVDRDFLQFQVH